MKKKVTMLGLLIMLAISSSVVQLLHAQTRELKKIRLNVFRTDAATAVARVQGFFAAVRSRSRHYADTEFNGPDERPKPG